MITQSKTTKLVVMARHLAVAVALTGWVLCAASAADAAQTIRPSADGTLADGSVYGPRDGVADNVDWTFNGTSYEGAITLSATLEHRLVWEYNLSSVTATPPVYATLSFTLRGAPVFPLPDVPVQVYAYPADLQESTADFSAGEAVLQGSVTVTAYQAPKAYTLDVSSAVNEALSSGTDKVAFRFQVDPGTSNPASQAFLDAVDTDLASKPHLTIDTAPPPSPQILAWRSVKTHGSQGTPLAIELDPAATGAGAASEPRNGGVQQIEVDFSGDVTALLTGTVQADDLTNGGTISATSQTLMNDGTTLVIEFSGGLPDQTCYRIDLSPNIPGLGSDADCVVRGLLGDINGDNATNNTDKSFVASMNGHPVSPDNVSCDINLDGSINNTDKSLVASRNGRGASCP